MTGAKLSVVLLLSLVVTSKGQCGECDEWGINWVIILLPLLMLALLAFAFAVYRALHFRNLFRKMHEANQVYLFEQKAAQATVTKKAKGADDIALELNKIHLKELQEDNARLAKEVNKLKDDLAASNSQLRAAHEQLAKLRATDRVVEKPVEVQKIVEVPVEKVVEVPVHQVVEVPKVVEKTVEVQKLVVDKAAQLQLQYANEDIEFLKRELAAAKAASYRPSEARGAEEPMTDDMHSQHYAPVSQRAGAFPAGGYEATNYPRSRQLESFAPSTSHAANVPAHYDPEFTPAPSPSQSPGTLGGMLAQQGVTRHMF
jgi:hypothetical protein